jgi:hypothetical protein
LHSQSHKLVINKWICEVESEGGGRERGRELTKRELREYKWGDLEGNLEGNLERLGILKGKYWKL